MADSIEVEQNLDILLAELDGLKQLRVVIKGRGEHKKQFWLQNVAVIEREVDEIQKQFDDIKMFLFQHQNVSYPAWNGLNKMVIEEIQFVKYWKGFCSALMEDPSELEENLDSLLAELEELKHLRDDGMKGITKHKMRLWFQVVADMERKVDEIQKWFDSFPATREFNEKVIQHIKGMKELKKLGNSGSDAVEKFISELEAVNIRQFSDTQLRSYTSNLRDLVGRGGFGDVYKGEFPNSVRFAVKVFKNINEVDIIDEQLLDEVCTTGRTYHQNIVRVFGYCFDVELKALVLEYMENGSLDKILYQNHHPSVSWEKLYSIAIGTAKGLTYLHENCSERIIHHDIKAGNVLLDSNFCPKVADFGLASLSKRDVSQVIIIGFKGTPGYAAPELCHEGAVVTYKCDIYSFSMLLFEILRRKRNDDGEKWFPLEVWEKYANGHLNEIILECGFREEDMEKAKTLAQVALWCAQYKPKDRPSMSTVVQILEGDVQVQPPPLLTPFPHHVNNASGSTSVTPACVYSLESSASMEQYNHYLRD